MDELTVPRSATRGRPAVIGLDVGTSSVKGLLAGPSRALASARRGYRLDVGPDGRVELDAEAVWRAARAVIRLLAARAGTFGHDVVGVCCGGSGDEAVWVDQRDRPVAPIPMAFDRRAAAEGGALVAAVGRDTFIRRTGLPPSGAYPLARLAWLRRIDRESADRIRRLLAWPEFVAVRLGVEPIAEPTLAARSAAYDVTTGAWDAALLRAAGLGETSLARLGPTGAIAGIVPPRIARGLGLGTGVAVVAGGFDQAMATRAAGIDRPGAGHLGAGSWEALSVLTEAPPFQLVQRGFSVGPAVDAPGTWSVMSSVPGATVLAWLGGLAAIGARPESTKARVARLLRRAGRAADTPTGVLVLNGFDAAGSIDGTALAGGVVAGLRLDVDAGTLARGMLEGIAFDVAERLDDLAAAGMTLTEIRVTGAGATDPRWIQLRADVLGMPVVAIEPRDAGVVAACALGASAAIGDRSLGEMVSRLTSVGPMVEPRRVHQERYQELLTRRAVLRRALRERSDELGGVERQRGPGLAEPASRSGA